MVIPVDASLVLRCNYGVLPLSVFIIYYYDDSVEEEEGIKKNSSEVAVPLFYVGSTPSSTGT